MGRFSLLVPLMMLAAACAALAGCAGTAPYVYQEEEFDRSRPGFGRPLEDRSELTICYNKRSTTPDELAQLARDECGRFDKKPLYVSQDFATCPLFVPTAINFRCVRPAGGRH